MRPQSLAQVAALAARGESFDRSLANFLDAFYACPSVESLVEEPALLAANENDPRRVQDAYLAATAEELARRSGLPAPRWAANPLRALRRPWFAETMSSLRAVLIHESPPAFRCRNLFVSENALSRV
jgi:hypothetical protein